jgi:DNA-binding NtrC family response regulator
MRYDWPGNVRELQNCITRAVVMSERPIIQAEYISLDVETLESDHDAGLPPSGGIKGTENPAPDLNHRQRKAWAKIMTQGRITRSQYQEIIGGNLPTRTAIYDLQDLVAKGVLKKTGSGPATHYILSDNRSSDPR